MGFIFRKLKQGGGKSEEKSVTSVEKFSPVRKKCGKGVEKRSANHPPFSSVTPTIYKTSQDNQVEGSELLYFLSHNLCFLVLKG